MTEQEKDTVMAEEEEEDDPIVAEYDVYIANRLVENLHLFQFPMRPPNRTYNFEKMQSMRMQLRSKRFELAFNTHGTSMNSIFETQPEDAKEENIPYHLSSSRVRNKTNYAVGVVRGNMLHMTGLANIHQFRPDTEANMKSNKTAVETQTEDKEEKLTSQQQAKQDQMQKQYEGRLRSVWLAEQEQDSWVDMGLSSASNPESKKGILERMFAGNEKVEMNPRHTSNLYLNMLFKRPADASLKEGKAKIPLAMASEFDWKRQVESMMLSAKIMKFDRIKSLLTPQKAKDTVKDLPSDAELLKFLDTCCISIRGLFIVKSTPECSSAVLSKAREWILLHFWRTEQVKRSDITGPEFKLPVDVHVMKTIMSDFAELKKPRVDDDYSKRRWVLKHGNKDLDILQLYPQEAKGSDSRWERERVKRITKNVDPDNTPEPLAFSWTPERLTQAGRAAPRVTEVQVESWISREFASKGVWNQAVLVAKFRDALRKSSSTIPDELFLKVLRQVTIPFNDALILKKISNKEELEIDQFRPRYIKAFQDKSIWKKKELEAHIGDVPKHHAQKILDELSTVNGQMVAAKAGSLN
eukprot:TRINITY_DN4046_c3_g1_i1.p1 TRINITY_DN4046_c3_g1~~TRINITY_DN4046_c3_g1_i1.p1  ORF type:complete len:582 (+),score=104.82 TRINITY_DN4046_c3_g1_i1:66-1811(+)